MLSLLTSAAETGWDLGPSAAVLQSLQLTHLSSSNKRQRDYMGLKIALCMRSRGKFWTKRYKEKKNIQLPFLKSGEQKPGCRKRKSPSTEPTKAGQTTRATPPAGPRHTCPLIPVSSEGSPTLGSEQGHPLLVLLPPEANRGAPVTLCLNSLPCVQSISIDWERPETLVGITLC